MAKDAPDLAGGDNAHRVAAGQLRTFVERVERLEEEKKAIADDVKDVFGEAKGQGYDTKVMKEMIRLRRLDKEKRDEAEAKRQMYADALGIFG